MNQLKLYGLGGQGVVTAAEILVHAVSIFEQKYARSLPAFGHERRGAPVFADVMIDDQPILLNSFVYEPNYVLVFDPSVVDKGIEIGIGADEETVLVVNANEPRVIDRLQRGLDWKEVYYVDATGIAIGTIGSNIPNTAMLGALAKTGVVEVQSVCGSLREIFGSDRAESNIKAVREAHNQTKTV